jgi:hypothetical protein
LKPVLSFLRHCRLIERSGVFTRAGWSRWRVPILSCIRVSADRLSKSRDSACVPKGLYHSFGGNGRNALDLGGFHGTETGRLNRNGHRMIWLNAASRSWSLSAWSMSAPNSCFEEQRSELHRQHRKECVGLPFGFLRGLAWVAERRQRARLRRGHGTLLNP